MIRTQFTRVLRLSVAASALFYTASVSAESMNIAPFATTIGGLSETVAGGDSTISTDFPGGENPGFAFDGTTVTKYLAFDGIADDGDASDSGVIVFFPAPATIESVRFGIANDAPERDPVNFTLEGSNSLSLDDFTVVSQPFAPDLTFDFVTAGPADAADWTPIVGSPILTGVADPADTFLDTFNARFTFTDEPPFNRSADSFTNTEGFTAYRILFPDLRLDGNGIFQIGEIELIGTIVPEPTTAVLAVFAGCTLLGARRRS